MDIRIKIHYRTKIDPPFLGGAAEGTEGFHLYKVRNKIKPESFGFINKIKEVGTEKSLVKVLLCYDA